MQKFWYFVLIIWLFEIFYMESPLLAAPSSEPMAAAPFVSDKFSWKTRLAARAARWQLKKISKNIALPLVIASRDSNCLLLTLKSGEKVYVQNANITLDKFIYQPCGQYKVQEQTLNLKNVLTLESSDGQTVFSSRPRNKSAAVAAIKVPVRNAACSKIVLGNGEAIEARNIKIGEAEVVFNLCGQPNGSEISISRWYIYNIWNEHGQEMLPSSGDQSITTTRADPYAITAFLLSLLGLSIPAIIFGILSLKRIKANPKTYHGKDLALAGLILGSLLLLFVFFTVLLLLL